MLRGQTAFTSREDELKAALTAMWKEAGAAVGAAKQRRPVMSTLRFNEVDREAPIHIKLYEDKLLVGMASSHDQCEGVGPPIEKSWCNG